MKTMVLALVVASLLLAPAAAQTGPWTDGEFVVHSSIGGAFKIFRVVPDTGAAEVLTTPLYNGGWSGSMTFDSHRGGLLANISLPPDGTFTYRLWLIAHDGTAAAMPGFSGSLRALASTGDGRVFFIRHSGAAQGPQTVEYYDANDVIQTLKDVDGVTPFQIEVEHLLYHASSNALIGSSSGWWSATDCVVGSSSIYRIPLSADGLQVAGPVTCAGLGSGTANIMTLDTMPNGQVLATIASGEVPSTSRLKTVDPLTLASADWADPWQGDIDGGVWCQRLGKAVIHAAGPLGYRLFTFTAGQTGWGDELPTSQPVAGWGGYSPADSLFEVDLNGPGCDGFQVPYGTGLAGKGFYVPLLGVIGCPDIGSLFTISINDVVGGAAGMLFVGLAPAALPFKGGTFLVGGVAAQIPVTVGGTPGEAGAGSLALPAMLTDPILSGVNIYMQAGFSDSVAVKGVSLSNGVRFQGG
jgi:hypothetical protein